MMSTLLKIQLLACSLGVATFAFAGPSVVVVSSPKGMVQSVGGTAAIDTFTIANIGDADAALTLLANATFFTVSPGSAVIAPGATQTVTLRGNASSQGILSSSVTISGSGVPSNGLNIAVRMMVTSPPIGPNLVAPDTGTGGDAVGGIPGFIVAGTNQQVSSSASFRNTASGTVQAMAVTSTDWLIPQASFVTIPGFQMGQASFTIDPSKRPDAPNPLGGVTGGLSLRFLGSDSAASISIISVVRPDVAAGEAPPLDAGELALFVPALSYRGRVYGDLSLAARRGDPAVTDLKLYFARALAGSPALQAQITQPPGSLALWFPSILASVFGAREQAGTIQLRGGLTRNVSVTAVQIADPGTGRAFYSALPVLRSDRGISRGETLLLSGVEHTDTVSTTLYLQEMSGSATSVQTEFFDAAGAPAGTKRVDNIGAFRSVEIINAVPSGGRSIRVTNLGQATVSAEALVSDNATLAAWPVVDTSRNSPASTAAWVVPVVSPPGTSQIDVFLSNSTSGPVAATVANFNDGSPPVNNVTLQPLQTQRISIPPMTGLLRLTAPAGTISASGRLTMTSAAFFGSFGGALPVVPLTSALGPSQATRFTGIDDTRFALKSSLILAEVGGGEATVRVTLRYNFVAGLAVSSQAVSTKEFSVAAGQMRIIPNLPGEVIGGLRDSIGDLRNMQVDVEIVGGSGKVIPFIESIDAGSGNVMLLDAGPADAPLCTPSATTLCLAGDRFAVSAAWQTSDGNSGDAQAVRLTPDTGYFTFFSASNVEAVVKVLSACGLNQKFWVFAGGLTNVNVVLTVRDTKTGTVKQYVNPQNTAFQPIQDTNAFSTCAAGTFTPAAATTVSIGRQNIGPADTPLCSADATTICLAGDRFAVSATWKTNDGSGNAQAVRLTADTGYFTFFNASNVEAVVKVLDACGLNQKFWVFAGGLTNVNVVLTVRDMKTGSVRQYINPQNTAFQPIQDTGAFATCR